MIKRISRNSFSDRAWVSSLIWSAQYVWRNLKEFRETCFRTWLESVWWAGCNAVCKELNLMVSRWADEGKYQSRRTFLWSGSGAAAAFVLGSNNVALAEVKLVLSNIEATPVPCPGEFFSLKSKKKSNCTSLTMYRGVTLRLQFHLSGSWSLLLSWISDKLASWSTGPANFLWYLGFTLGWFSDGQTTVTGGTSFGVRCFRVTGDVNNPVKQSVYNAVSKSYHRVFVESYHPWAL